MTPTNLTVVQIVSASYSGGTWLNLLLGSHPEAFSVGELKSVRKLGKAFCRLHGEACPFWSRVDLAADADPYPRIAELAQKRVLVVNNSSRDFGGAEPAAYHTRFIHLVRDGRAVVASYLRKDPALSAFSAARTWARSLRRNEEILSHAGNGSSTLVIYEKALAATEAELRRLAAFAGMDWRPEMLEYWRHDHCYLGGNLGTQHALKKQRGEAPPEDPRPAAGKAAFGNWDPEHYAKTDPARYVDERWKEELSTWQLLAFALAAGRTNRRYGYPRSTDRRSAAVTS